MATIYFNDILLPILPSHFKISTEGNNKEVMLVDGDNSNIINKPFLSTFTVESYFPNNPLDPPEKHINYILKAFNSMKVCKLSVIDVAVPVTFSCTIENFEYFEKGGQVGDVYYILKLKKYTGLQKYISAYEAPKNYETAYVHVDESLADISNKYYDNPDEYRRIIAANSLKGYFDIYPGQRLVIPYY